MRRIRIAGVEKLGRKTHAYMRKGDVNLNDTEQSIACKPKFDAACLQRERQIPQRKYQEKCQLSTNVC